MLLDHLPGGHIVKRLALPLAVLLLVTGGMGMALFVQAKRAQEVERQLTQSQQENARLLARNQELEQQARAGEAERQRLEERSTSLRTQLSSVTEELGQARVRLEDATRQAEELSRTRGQLMGEVSSLRDAHETVQQRAQRLEEANADLEGAVDRLRLRLEFLDRDYRQAVEQLAKQPSPAPAVPADVARMPEPPATRAETAAEPPSRAASAGAVELPPIVVRTHQAYVASPISGRVLEVNAAHGFVVVDRGSEDGVRVGMTFDILRGPDPVGRVAVMRARPNLAACDVIRAHTPGSLRPGDAVVQRSP
jgi:hypothetical protein